MMDIVGVYKKKVLFTVAEGRQTKEGKWMYQLKNSKGELHQSGKWFPEIEVKRP